MRPPYNRMFVLFDKVKGLEDKQTLEMIWSKYQIIFLNSEIPHDSSPLSAKMERFFSAYESIEGFMICINNWINTMQLMV